MKRYQLAILGIMVISLAALITNLVVRQGPVHDAAVVADLEALRSDIEAYHSANAALPPSLAGLHITNAALAARVGNYTYSVPGSDYSGNDYQLCATFASRLMSARPNSMPAYPMGDTYVDFNFHPKGYSCFSLTIVSGPKPL